MQRTHDWERDFGLVIRVAHGVAVGLDVLDPLLVAVEGVGGETDDLDATSVKVLLPAGDLTELGSAYLDAS